MTLVAFMAAALAMVMSTGSIMITARRHTIPFGRGVGTAAVMGVQLRLVGHTFLASIGLFIFVASSPELFTLTTIAGASYIGWLDVQGIRKGVVRCGSIELMCP